MQIGDTMKNNVVLIALGAFLLIACVAAAGLGFWAFTLNTKLTDTQTQLQDSQAQLQDSQGKNVTLQSTYDALVAENTQTKSDLEQAQTRIKELEDDLKAAEEKSTSLAAKIDKVLEKTDLLETFWAFDFDVFETKLRAANDDVLTQKYNDWMNSTSGTDESFNAYDGLVQYLIQSIKDAAK